MTGLCLHISNIADIQYEKKKKLRNKIHRAAERESMDKSKEERENKDFE